jgi:hypothetical protein
MNYSLYFSYADLHLLCAEKGDDVLVQLRLRAALFRASHLHGWELVLCVVDMRLC